MDFLIALYIFCILTSELMGAKTFPILSLDLIKLNGSVAIFLMPIIFSINDVITEVYGAERTRSIIRAGLIMIFLLFSFAIFAVWLPPSYRFVQSDPAYKLIFGQSIRISAASLIAFTFSDFLDVIVFVKIRKALGKKGLWLRNNVSNIVAQFFDTSIFMTLAFYSLGSPFKDNLIFLVSLIMPYWFLKCVMSGIETPFVYLGVRWLKSEKREAL